MNWLTGFHAVEEALNAGRALDRIVIARGRHGERVESIVQHAKSRGVPVRFEDRQQLDRLSGTREHQGVAGAGRGQARCGIRGFAPRKDATAGCWCCWTASRTRTILGAVVRTSLAAGAQGVVIPGAARRWVERNGRARVGGGAGASGPSRA